MAFSNERAVGNSAASRLTASLKSNIRSVGFKAHANNAKDDLMGYTKAIAVVHDQVNTLGETMPYLNKIVFRMPNHGFIQHYGTTTIRQNGRRTRKKPETKTYNFAAHYYNIPAKNFIDRAIRNSGIIDFVLSEITELRATDILVSLIRSMQNNVR